MNNPQTPALRTRPPQLLASGAPMPQLPAAVRSAVLAVQEKAPAVRDLGEKSLARAITEVLSAALFCLNHSTSYQDGPEDEPGTAIALLSLQVAQMVQRRFPAFKPAEVVEAVRRGSAGDYHNFKKDGALYLSIPAVQGWLTHYRDAARAQALDAIRRADEDLVAALGVDEHGRPMPRTCDFPYWHPLAAAVYIPQLLGKVAQAQVCYQPELGVDFFLYAWLEALGVLGRFCPPAERQALLDAECRRLAGRKVHLESRDIKAKYQSFAQAVLDQAIPDQHPLLSEAKQNCRAALLRAWVLSWASPAECDRWLIQTWAWAYFHHYQQPAANANGN